MVEPKPKTFGEWLRDKRQALGLSLQDIAVRTGLSKQTISTIERSIPRTAKGRPPRPRVETVDALADAVGAPIGEARWFAGIKAPEDAVEPDQKAKLLLYFTELPNSEREAAITMIEALWQRQHALRRAEQQAEKKTKKKRRSA